MPKQTLLQLRLVALIQNEGEPEPVEVSYLLTVDEVGPYLQTLLERALPEFHWKVEE